MGAGKVVVDGDALIRVLELVDQCVEDLSDETADDLDRLSEPVGFIPRIEGAWRDRVDQF